MPLKDGNMQFLAKRGIMKKEKFL